MQSTLGLIALPFVAALGYGQIWFGRQRTGFGSFFAANRAIGFWTAALSIPIAWLWSNTIILGPQKAYEGGIAPVLWLAGLNCVGLLSFAICAWQMNRVADPEIPTLTGYIEKRFGTDMVWVYTIGILGTSIYSVVAQLVGAFVLLNYVTGIDKSTLAMLLAPMMLILACARGVQSSFAGDMVKAGMIVLVLVVVLLVAYTAGIDVFDHAVSGVSQKPVDFFDYGMLRFFVIPLAISWISGGALDHQLYQRSRSFSPAAKNAAWVGILPFGVVVLIISSAGFFAPWNVMKGLDHQLAGFVAIQQWMPVMGGVFIIAVAAALLATGASALNASACTWAADIVKPLQPEWSPVMVSRVAMGLILVVCVGIALTGVTLLQLVLFIGAFRGALLFPTLLGLFTKKGLEHSRMFAVSIALTMITGTAVALLSGDPLWGGVVALTISAAVCFVELRRQAVSI